MRLIGCQLNLIWENKLANYAEADRLLKRHAIAPGSLVALPEMFASGFTMNVAAAQEATPSLTERFLSEKARQYGAFFMGGLVSAGPGKKGWNEAVVFDPTGTLIARYKKIHPFALGKEAEHYAAGHQIATFDWHGFKAAPFICYDLRFPEIFRLAARSGVHLFIVIANWPIMRIQHWVTLLQARAIENQAYVLGVNRTGTDPKLTYSGRSIIVDPHGEILADAGETEAIISADASLEAVNEWRSQFPALRDMHDEFFPKLRHVAGPQINAS